MITEHKIKDTVIFFDDEKHKFWRMQDGKKIKISSVTKFTGIIDKSRPLIFWAVGLARDYLQLKINNGEQITVIDIQEACKQHSVKKEEAADIGTKIHALVSRWIKAQEFTSEELESLDNESVRNGFDAFMAFQAQHNFKWLESERVIYYRDGDVEYAGIMDALAEVDGRIIPVDFKSANGIYPEHVLQVGGGYCLAYEWETNIRTGKSLIVKFGKLDGSFAYRYFDQKLSYQTGFLHCFHLKNTVDGLDKELEL